MMEKKEAGINLEDEVDLVDLVKSIWNGKMLIAKVASIFVLSGLLIAFTSTVEYEASCKLLPESQETQMSNLGGLAGLAGLAGVDLGSLTGSSSGVLTPQLYPEIVKSLPFVLEVMQDTVYFENEKLKTTSFYYFKEIAKPSLLGYVLKYTLGLPSILKSAFFDSEEESSFQPIDFYRLKKADLEIIEKFKQKISVEIDDGTGIIEIVVEMPDPFVAAQLAEKIEKMITNEVVKYKTNKSLMNLEFVLEAHDEAQEKFEDVQLRLAKVTDKNKNVTTATAEIEIKKIQHEYDIAFDVYKGLSSQVEKAKIKLREETPVFTVIEPVRIPSEKSKPRRMLTAFVFGVVGAVFASFYLILKHVKVY